MARSETHALWHLATEAGQLADRVFADRDDRFTLANLVSDGILPIPEDCVRHKSVLISTERQLPAVLALLHLDGIARRILLCPPDLSPEYLPAVIAEADVDLILSDGTGPAGSTGQSVPVIPLHRFPTPDMVIPQRNVATEWLLFTSGTTGKPKIVVHTLASLTGPLAEGPVILDGAVWSTFYDIRRYGGLQMLLRALLGGASMVLSQAREPVGDFLIRAGSANVTHISGTPSHWRRALMTPEIVRLDPAYVRLSGEVADQAILNRLAATFPKASIAHAFASTEAGVAFDVRDGLAGFPADFITGANVDLRVQDGSLRIRSPRTANRYLGDAGRLADVDGFVDTGDMLELRDGRYYFVGRREGIINVGGQKVYPEEIEAAINLHPAVQMSRVRGRRNPIIGAIVVADILLKQTADRPFETVRAEIMQTCRDTLSPYKVPASLYHVQTLAVSESGKLIRTDA
jgi:acyl-coenzyme A synthetase/AMP-(fatty) acid ligase